jgi:hypothetical protein
MTIKKIKIKSEKLKKSNEDEIETSFYFHKLFKIKYISIKEKKKNQMRIKLKQILIFISYLK